MTNQYFSFQRPPFAAFPDPESYFPAETMEAARQTVLHVLRQESGIPLVFGEPGMGKSLLLRVLQQQLENDGQTVYVANPRLRSPKSLYQHLLFSVHQSYCGMQENELRLLFFEYLRQETNGSLVLLIDEAHSLTRSVLEELRVLLHQNENGGMHVRIVLAGNHKFEERLTHPHLDAFQQQVVARCYLEKFRWDETSEEILWQLHKVGCQNPGSLFLPEARKTVHKLTEGLPRIVHQLCRQAIDGAVEQNACCIDETLVQQAWARLQQLPGCESVSYRAEFSETPNVTRTSVQISMQQSVAQETQSPLIEFGALDDDESRSTNVIPNEANQESEPELESVINPVYRRPVFDEEPASDAFLAWEKPPVSETGEHESKLVRELETLGEALSDKDVVIEKSPQQQEGESCRKLLDELSVMEQLLTQEITVINRMKKLESDCLSRRVRQVSATQILASFPEMSNSR